ncbi:hypothetical protein [Winogradskyella sp.]|uniref:hypothetical protein n=1 Tax=Winogradskyella sp. TaxID=1883156 RepID=UPI00260B13C8|nr:hypothetical protein [Winogradskyella sp.]
MSLIEIIQSIEDLLFVYEKELRAIFLLALTFLLGFGLGYELNHNNEQEDILDNINKP